MFVLDDASDIAASRGFTLIRILAEALTLPKPSDPDPDDLLTDAILPWLASFVEPDAGLLRWSRSMYPRNRVGRHRAASDVSAFHQIGIATKTFEDESAMESHTLRPAENLTELIRYTRRAGAGSLSLLAPPTSTPHTLLEALIALRAAHGERLRLQHCAEALTPLGVIVLSREWDDGGEASRDMAFPHDTVIPPIPSDTEV
jgi:hypothetical protein